MKPWVLSHHTNSDSEAILVLVDGGRSRDGQGHSQLHSEFKASLGYKNLRRTEDRDELSFFMSVVETG